MTETGEWPSNPDHIERERQRKPDAPRTRQAVMEALNVVAKADGVANILAPISLALVYIGDAILEAGKGIEGEIQIIRERPEDEEQRRRERQRMGGV